MGDQVSNRRRAALAALVCGVALVVGACGGGGPGSAPPPSANAGAPSPAPPPSETPAPPPPASHYVSPYPYVEVNHSALVQDPTRRQLIAFVTPADPVHGRRLAVIDVDSRAVVHHSPPVDFLPKTMAVSSDGAYLYVAARDRPAVIRLRLPGFEEDLRWDLGLDTLPSGVPGEPMWADHVAVSPIDSRLVAVGVRNRIPGGIRLYRDGQVVSEQVQTALNQPTPGTVSAFSPDGRTLYVSSQSLPDTVRRHAVLGDHLGPADSELTWIKGNLDLRLQVLGGSLLSGSGCKADLPSFELRGCLRSLLGSEAALWGPQGCDFADPQGQVAVCATEVFPGDIPVFTTNSLAFYDLTSGEVLQVIPLDVDSEDMGRPLGPVSAVFRTGDGRFAVSSHPQFDPALTHPLGDYFYLGHNRRIYFVE